MNSFVVGFQVIFVLNWKGFFFLFHFSREFFIETKIFLIEFRD